MSTSGSDSRFHGTGRFRVGFHSFLIMFILEPMVGSTEPIRNPKLHGTDRVCFVSSDLGPQSVRIKKNFEPGTDGRLHGTDQEPRAIRTFHFWNRRPAPRNRPCLRGFPLFPNHFQPGTDGRFHGTDKEPQAKRTRAILEPTVGSTEPITFALFPLILRLTPCAFYNIKKRTGYRPAARLPPSPAHPRAPHSPLF